MGCAPFSRLRQPSLGPAARAVSDDTYVAASFTPEGAKLEKALRREQARLLERVFAEVGAQAVENWLSVNQALGRIRQADHSD